MDISPVFSHCSAVRFWGTDIPDGCTLSTNMPHIVFPEKRRRRRFADVVTHTWSGEFLLHDMPAEGFSVVKPPMAWAQMARHCNEESLAVIAGSFACRDTRRRVATIDELVRYATDTRNFPGRGKCLSIAPFLSDHADSPPESQVYVLVMRNKLGKPVVNHRVDFGGGGHAFIDIAYPDIKFGIEYQGSYHAGPEQMRSDARRFNRLKLHGWEIVLVTADDLATDVARKAIVQTIRTLMLRQGRMIHLARSIL
ncbi:hypothetical protein JS531_00235 [Bifidobacterium sp. CP2]|uniref:endonuclease domain-containing protein n=1 Tax=Bifidobacterium sp. CP2 TaxID=2809025 RepID=UPI001BDD9EDC|nr:hypothetical protein [Bifidobacterium sp. CP2]MBT1180432.1 hypothetical protein [Bifidobacterium sp. CP2]